MNVCGHAECIKAAAHMLSRMSVTILESIVVDELCEFSGRENLTNNNIMVISVVRTRSVDNVTNIHRKELRG